MKDAYAPYWGFSIWDFGTGSVGSFWPVFQEYYRPAQAIGFKFSYFNTLSTTTLLSIVYLFQFLNPP